MLLFDVLTRKINSQEEGLLDSLVRPDWADVLKSTSVADSHKYASDKEKKKQCFNVKSETDTKIWHYNCTANQDKLGNTALIVAAEKGYTAVTKALLAVGADANKASNEGVTPLFTAAQNGHTAITSALLERGAKVDQRTKKEDTPLMVAAACGHQEVVQMLLKGGATKDMKNKDGKTALDLAHSKNHSAVVALLQ